MCKTLRCLYQVELTAPVTANGMIDDYNIYKSAVRALCDEYDEFFLLPGHSEHLTLQHTQATEDVTASVEIEWPTAEGKLDHIVLPASDILILPVENITLESLAKLLTERLLGDHAGTMVRHGVTRVAVRVSSGPGQAASYCATP